MPEWLQAIVDKLMELPEDQFMMLLESLASRIWLNVETKEEDEKEEKALAEKEWWEKEEWIEWKNEENKEVSAEEEEEQINPQDLVAKIAF